jgi:large subunit ribosomal protein L9
MEVILLEKIRNLGDLGDQVNVKPGYGRNYLIPQGKAVRATAENKEIFESRRAELEKTAKDALTRANARARAMEDLVLEISSRASEEGKLFGSVGVHEIVDAAAAADVEIDKAEVNLPTGPIKLTGEHMVEIALHPEVTATIQVVVVAEA